MSKMVRKQLYIEPRQDKLLKERARRYRITEADLIRQALDAALLTSTGLSAPDPTAWQQVKRYIEHRAKTARVKKVRRRWTRDELYDR